MVNDDLFNCCITASLFFRLFYSAAATNGSLAINLLIKKFSRFVRCQKNFQQFPRAQCNIFK